MNDCRLIVDRCTITSTGNGVLLSTIRIAGNQNGVVQDVLSEFVLANNLVTLNSINGVVQNTSRNVFTMRNNVVRNNAGGNIVGGTLTPLTFN